MNNHTPGPWSVEVRRQKRFDIFTGEEKKSTKSIFINGGPMPSHIAVVAPREETDIYEGDGEANGHLIAAAPELKRALEHYVSLATTKDTYTHEHLQEALANAQAAIAKAEGR